MAAEGQDQYLRVGVISAINYPAGTCRVFFEDRDNAASAEFPMLSWMYFPPRIGDQVLVAHLPNGQAAAVILGRFWCNGHRPVEGRPAYYRQEFCLTPGIAYEDFDAKTGVYKIKIGKSKIEMTTTGDITIKSDSSITLKSPTININ